MIQMSANIAAFFFSLQSRKRGLRAMRMHVDRSKLLQMKFDRVVIMQLDLFMVSRCSHLIFILFIYFINLFISCLIFLPCLLFLFLFLNVTQKIAFHKWRNRLKFVNKVNENTNLGLFIFTSLPLYLS